jgi:hypothetical protein
MKGEEALDTAISLEVPCGLGRRRAAVVAFDI